MSTTTIPKAPSLPESSPAEAVPVFAPSAELGAQLQNLEQAQAEINRRKAEELAHLRELQNRD